jgi:hypothetical protein
MAIQPQFTAFNPYQLQAEQEAMQRMLQQQEAEQLQQQQAYANWVHGQQQQQQQQQLQPQPQLQIQPTGFGYDRPILFAYSSLLITDIYLVQTIPSPNPQYLLNPLSKARNHPTGTLQSGLISVEPSRTMTPTQAHHPLHLLPLQPPQHLNRNSGRQRRRIQSMLSWPTYLRIGMMGRIRSGMLVLYGMYIVLDYNGMRGIFIMEQVWEYRRWTYSSAEDGHSISQSLLSSTTTATATTEQRTTIFRYLTTCDIHALIPPR